MLSPQLEISLRAFWPYSAFKTIDEVALTRFKVTLVETATKSWPLVFKGYSSGEGGGIADILPAVAWNVGDTYPEAYVPLN